MAFCNNCGTQLNEGAKFCAKCGNAAVQTPPQQTPPPQQASANTFAPQGTYQNAASGQVPPPPYNTVYAETPPEVKKLIRAAAICAYAVFVIIFCAGIVIRMISQYERIIDSDMLGILPFLLILTIPMILSFIGEKKKKRGLVMTAGIVYIWTILGIPSGILCIIAFTKMPKRAK